MGCWNIVSISLLSEKEGKGKSIERGFERRREHEERWREKRGEKERGEREEKERGERGRSSRREIATIDKTRSYCVNRWQEAIHLQSS